MSAPAIRKPKSQFSGKVARALVRLIGWKVEGHLPPDPKFVAILYPHTSNWDLPIGVLCATALGLFTEYENGFMIKDSVTKAPVVGPIVRWFGGIGIDRTAKFNAVDQMVQRFAERERMMLAITPEGTRKFRPYLKSGFYQIALKAKVPILFTYLDFKRRVGGLGPAYMPTGNVEADLEVMRQFYAPITAYHPEKVGTVQFKEEFKAEG